MSNNNDERSPRFSRAILGRIIAVLVFVGLGTFAVINSIAGCQTSQAAKLGLMLAQQLNQQQAKSDPNPDPTPAQTSQSPTPGKETKLAVFNGPSTQPDNNNNFGAPPAKIQTDVKTSLKKEPSANSNLVEQPKKNTSRPSSMGQFQPNPSQSVSAAKPTTPLRQDASFQPRAGFGTSANTDNPKNNGEFNKTFEPPKSFDSQTVANQTPVVPTNPPVKKTAQKLVPNKSPFDDGGFKPKRPVASKLSDGIANAADNAKQTANQIKTKLADTEENMKNGVQQKTSDFANELRSSKLGSGIGGNNLQAQQKTGINSNPQTFLPKQSPRAEPTIQLPSAPNISISSKSNSTGAFGGGTTQNGVQSVSVDKAANLSPLRNSPPPTNLSPRDFNATPTAGALNTIPQKQPSPTRMQTVGNSRIVAPSNNNSAANLTASSTVNSTAQASPGDRQLEGAQTPSITIQKIAPREIQVDTPADFQLVIKNSGRVSARNVIVTDRVPAGTEFVQASPQPTQNNGTLTWNLETLRPGQEKRINLRLKPVRPGEIGSVAQVTFTAQASMRTLVTKPILQIKHTIQPKILIGDNVAVDIIVENKGDGPATNVMIQEDVPAQLAFQEGFRELEYEVGRLEPGQSKRIQLTLKAAQIGRARNVLFASASGNLRAQHAADFEVIAPKLVATGDGPKTKYLKREALHQFTVENQGTAPATNVDLIAKLPNGLQFIGANNQGKYDRNTHSIYWSMANLAPGIAASVDVKTSPLDTGEQTIHFEARADLGQRTSIDKPLLVEHLVDVFFDIDDVVDPIEIGSGTSYRLRVVNQGTKTATNVRLVVDFPQGIRPTSVDGNLPHQMGNNQVVFAPISSMNPGDELKLVVHGTGVAAGDHRVAVKLQADGREAGASKEETTRVYNDRK